MKEIVIVGDKKFTLGFQIAGVSKAFELSKEHPENTIKELMSNETIGLIIIQEQSLENIDEYTKEEVMQSIDPVFLVLSEQDTNEEMRKLIKKSIGVDLWDKE